LAILPVRNADRLGGQWFFGLILKITQMPDNPGHNHKLS
jgi:hypothetical protein